MRTSSEELNLQFRKLSVLIVDDNAFMRNILRGLLSAIGIKKIAEAGEGIRGRKLIRVESPDLVIFDWEMPLLDGQSESSVHREFFQYRIFRSLCVGAQKPPAGSGSREDWRQRIRV